MFPPTTVPRDPTNSTLTTNDSNGLVELSIKIENIRGIILALKPGLTCHRQSAIYNWTVGDEQLLPIVSDQ